MTAMRAGATHDIGENSGFVHQTARHRWSFFLSFFWNFANGRGQLVSPSYLVDHTMKTCISFVVCRRWRRCDRTFLVQIFAYYAERIQTTYPLREYMSFVSMSQGRLWGIDCGLICAEGSLEYMGRFPVFMLNGESNGTLSDECYVSRLRACPIGFDEERRSFGSLLRGSNFYFRSTRAQLPFEEMFFFFVSITSHTF